MKKLIAVFLCMLIAVNALTATVVFAQEAPAEGTVITIEEADTVSDTDSYVLTDDGEPVLKVVRVKEFGATAALSDSVANEYYTAEFMIPESNYSVFLTGLTQDNVGEIRQAIIDSYVEGEDFALTNLGFIDAEKTGEKDGDDNLCWAASTSNLLTYTGWAAQAGFDSADDLFEAFIDAFEDKGGNVKFATGWFINGVSASSLSQPREDTGKYLPQYNYTDLVEEFDMTQNCAGQLATVYDRLKNGSGVSLSLNIYGTEGYEGAHAVTCWGFVTDARYPKTSKQFYKSIFTTDSDSHKYYVTDGKDRRDADDVMSLFALEPVDQEGTDTYRFDITEKQTALISTAVTIVPFSEAVPSETSPDATLDMINYPDIILDPFVLTDDPEQDNTVTTFTPNAVIYYQPYMMNAANADYYGKLSLQISVKDSQGNEVYAKAFNYHQNLTIPSETGMRYNKESFNKKLPVGDYTITASFNSSHQTAEAYFFNNTRSIDFKVREQYLIGDIDGDEEVSAVDVTMFQRVIARMEINVDDKMKQRGNVNDMDGLDMLDVTFLQRYLAHVDIQYPVNELRFYN